MKANPSFFLILALMVAPLATADVVSDLTERADKGEAAAQVELAGLYAKGEGVTKDEAAALKWWLKAAEQGDANAQFSAGRNMLKGKDTAEAVKLLTKSAEQGNAEAQATLGGIYIGGKGVRKSSSEAAKWFMMAAEGGNAAAQCQLGRMHLAGAGVPKDDVEAYKWSNLAATQGDLAAKKVVSFLTAKMSPGEVAQGQAKSREFLEMKKAREVLGDPPAEPETVEPAPPIEPE